jgi:hypothetical protein
LENANNHIYVTSASAALDFYLEEENELNTDGIDWTEIPKLRKKMTDMSERHYHNTCSNLNQKLDEINSFAKTKNELYAVQLEDRHMIAELIRTDLKNLRNWFDILDDTFCAIRKTIFDEEKITYDIDHIEFSNGRQMRGLSSERWNTYKACTARYGSFRKYDLNFEFAETCYVSSVKRQYENVVKQVKNDIEKMFVKGFAIIEESEKQSIKKILDRFPNRAAITIVTNIVEPSFRNVVERLQQHRKECFVHLSKFSKAGISMLRTLLQMKLEGIYEQVTSYVGTGSHSKRMNTFEQCIDKDISIIFRTFYQNCIISATDRLRQEVDMRIIIKELLQQNKALVEC